MDWLQFIGIIGTTVGSLYVFSRMTVENIQKLDERMTRMENYHREDMNRMDDKWERLFERLLLKDQQ